MNTEGAAIKIIWDAECGAGLHITSSRLKTPVSQVGRSDEARLTREDAVTGRGNR